MRYIDDENCNHSIGTLAMKNLKPVEEENPYTRFGYGPQKSFNHNQEQV